MVFIKKVAPIKKTTSGKRTTGKKDLRLPYISYPQFWKHSEDDLHEAVLVHNRCAVDTSCAAKDLLLSPVLNRRKFMEVARDVEIDVVLDDLNDKDYTGTLGSIHGEMAIVSVFNTPLFSRLFQYSPYDDTSIVVVASIRGERLPYYAEGAGDDVLFSTEYIVLEASNLYNYYKEACSKLRDLLWNTYKRYYFEYVPVSRQEKIKSVMDD